jgi:O-antigen/teichoic acid export membrane protein
MANAVISLRSAVARGAFASGAAEMVTRALTIVLSIAVARALDPQEVGLLGLGVIVVGILSVVTGCAETAGVIGRSGGTDPQYAWASMAVRGVATGGLLALAPLFLPAVVHLLAGRESSSVELTGLIHVLLWQLVLDFAATYPRVLLQRRLDLTPLVGASLVQIIAHVVLSLVLLGLGYGAMGVATSTLVAGGLSGALVWSRLLSSPGARWDGGIKARLWRQTAASTARVFVGSFIGYLNGRVDNLLVAGVLGPATMSFYGMAWSASRIPAWILQQALGLVLVPTLARVGSDAERMERVILESLRHSYLLLAPVCAVLFVTADSLVVNVLGMKWLPVVPALQVMSVGVLVVPVVIASSGLLVATNRGHLISLATGAQLITLLLTVAPLAAFWGILGAAAGELAAAAVSTATLISLCRRNEPRVNCWRVASVRLPIIAALCAGLLAFVISAELRPGLMKLAVQVGVLLTGYGASMWLLGGRAQLLELINVIRDVTRRPVAPAAVSPGAGQ